MERSTQTEQHNTGEQTDWRTADWVACRRRVDPGAGAGRRLAA